MFAVIKVAKAFDFITAYVNSLIRWWPTRKLILFWPPHTFSLFYVYLSYSSNLSLFVNCILYIMYPLHNVSLFFYFFLFYCIMCEINKSSSLLLYNIIDFEG
jgi:hypothetical protein